MDIENKYASLEKDNKKNRVYAGLGAGMFFAALFSAIIFMLSIVEYSLEFQISSGAIFVGTGFAPVLVTKPEFIQLGVCI